MEGTNPLLRMLYAGTETGAGWFQRSFKVRRSEIRIATSWYWIYFAFPGHLAEGRVLVKSM
jgi:hypothetical protein